MFGRRQEICVGPMSGQSNAEQVLLDRGIEPTPERVRALLEVAKTEHRILAPEDIDRIVVERLMREAGATPGPA
jgi:2-isopropylmalate synthase